MLQIGYAGFFRGLQGPYGLLPLAIEVYQDGVLQGRDVIFKRRVYGIQPMGAPQVVTHFVCGLYILDAERDDGDALVEGLVDLVQDVFGCVSGPDEDKYLAGIDGMNNGSSEIGPGGDITRGYPDPDFIFLQFRANGVGDGFIFGRVTDKHIMCHFLTPPQLRWAFHSNRYLLSLFPNSIQDNE